jgi:hypothetical protein
VMMRLLRDVQIYQGAFSNRWPDKTTRFVTPATFFEGCTPAEIRATPTEREFFASGDLLRVTGEQSATVDAAETYNRSFHVHQQIRKDDAMSTERSALEDLISKLKQERDELKVQMHLASMDAKDEYERISARIDELTNQYEPVKDAVEETAENVFSALGMVADELKVGFNRVRKAIKEE